MGADTSSCITSAGKAINAAFASRCSSPAEDCVNACAKESKNLATCKELKKRADDAKTQSGGDDQANKDANKSGQQSGTGGMPQMPQQQQDQSSPSPSPSSVAAPATNVDCTANPTDSSCNATKPVTDTANLPSPAAFQSGSSGGGGGSSSSSSLPSVESTSPSTGNTASAGMPSGGSGGGGGFGSSNTNSNKDVSPKAYEDAARNITDVLNGERGGGGGGGSAGGAGGFSGYGSGEAMNLSSYLPGGSHDPTRKPAAVAKKPGSMEIASVHENIFSMISKRIQILCKLKEIRDCD